MSWDVMLIKPQVGQVDSVGEIGPEVLPIGSMAEVLSALRALFPHIWVDPDHSDDTFAHLAGEGYSINIRMGRDDPVTVIMLFIRGSGGEAVIDGVLRPFCEYFGALAFDCGDGTRIDLRSKNRAEGFRRWRAFLDQIISRGQ